VTIEEKDNYVYERSQTSDGIENHAGLMYEINVYSNKSSGKKSQCKEIFTLIDGEMASMGFTRTMLNPFPNEEDATIYRMIGRYKAVVSSDQKIYRR
jgi:tetrahydromethanopterin S-methyltransferase subunit B